MGWKVRAAMAVFCVSGLLSTRASACPFCSAVSQTLTERINTADAAVLVELVESPPRSSDSTAPVSNEAIEAAKSIFRVVKVYRGAPDVKVGDTIKALYLGKAAPGSKSLLTGLDPKAPQWAMPVELTPRALEYLEQVLQLPARGTERLHFCENYLEDAETLLQEDALNEFALADVPTIYQARGKFDHDRLVRWIQNPATPETRRRLYFTLLGSCGNEHDVPILEAMIRSGDQVQMRGLDALLACYLTLGGPQRLPLVEELFLRKPEADYTQTYAAIMAVRFHGQQGDVIPQKRAVAALRLMLDRPQLADLVIPDLARWEDWDSVDKMVALFKASTKEWSYIRVPIINFLRACPKPEAKTKLDELAKLDPDSFKRAATFFPFGAGSSAAPKGPPADGAAKKSDAPPAKETKEAPARKQEFPASQEEAISGRPGTTVALVASSGDAAAEPKGDDSQATETADAPLDLAASTALAAMQPAVVPAISQRWLAMLVGGVPVGVGLVLFGVIWSIIRLPKPKSVDEA